MRTVNRRRMKTHVTVLRHRFCDYRTWCSGSTPCLLSAAVPLYSWVAYSVTFPRRFGSSYSYAGIHTLNRFFSRSNLTCGSYCSSRIHSETEHTVDRQIGSPTTVYSCFLLWISSWLASKIRGALYTWIVQSRGIFLRWASQWWIWHYTILILE